MHFMTLSEAVHDWMTIAPEFRTEAALAKRISSTSKYQDHTAWLIEINEPPMVGPLYFQFEFDDDWTADHDKACHFSRKQDAEKVIEHHGWTRAAAIEHMWPQPSVNT